ncbi:MAG: hypothetical protein LC104_21640 [Bacteroidales bacterium]|nr:hypothetical protein [Bacteroidales bacterium]
MAPKNKMSIQQILTMEPNVKTREIVHQDLQALTVLPGGLTPSAVLNSARNPQSPLHRFFIWDDTEAAARYRECQAYCLIRSIKVTIQPTGSKPVTVRAFVNIKEAEGDGTINFRHRGTYIPIENALIDEESKRQMLANARRDLAAFRAKYSTLNELASVITAIDAVMDSEEFDHPWETRLRTAVEFPSRTNRIVLAHHNG